MQLEPGATAIVDSRAGAGGRLAVENVRTSEPDGNTLLVTPGSIMTIYPSVYSKLSYDPVRDFRAITPLASVPYSVNVGPMVPASVKTMKDFAAWAKANPDKASYGSPGNGTTPHYVGVMFAKAAGFGYVHVPYKGGAPALQDVMAGQIASSVNVVSEVVPSAQAGKVRALAVSSGQRLPQLPDVPTFAEAGYGDLQSQEWFGLFAPAATPAATVTRLNQAAVQAYGSPEVKQALDRLAFSVTTSSADEFAALLRRDLDRWAPVVKATGFKIED
jgi:tripartite-type tricarboxylate transporter receptor subunit TctC